MRQVSVGWSNSWAPVCLPLWEDYMQHNMNKNVLSSVHDHGCKHDCPLVPIKAHCFHTSASDRNKDSKPPAIEPQLTGIKRGDVLV